MKFVILVLLVFGGIECRKRHSRNAEVVLATFPDQSEAYNYDGPKESLPDPETVIASIPQEKILNKPKRMAANNTKSCSNCPKDASDSKSKSQKNSEGFEIVEDEPVEADEISVASGEFSPISFQAEPAKMAESKPKITRKAIDRPNLKSENSAESITLSILPLFAIILFICLQANL